MPAGIPAIRLCLDFAVTDTECCLESVTFNYPNNPKPLFCRRGATSTGDTGSFPWTRAVQGLSVLGIRAALASRFTDISPTLQGMAGSLAASLDSAVSKEPVWTYEMFGSDSKGRSVLRRIIIRLNPERKRPGPVVLRFRDEIAAAVLVRVNGHECVDVGRLEELAGMLEAQDKSETQDSEARNNSGLAFPRSQLLPSIFQIIREEAQRGLQETNIFSKRDMSETLSYLNSHQPFRQIGGQAIHITSDLDQSLTDSALLGLGVSDHFLSRHLKSEQPIRVLCGVGGVASLCIFRYLVEVKGYNIAALSSWLSSLVIYPRRMNP